MPQLSGAERRIADLQDDLDEARRQLAAAIADQRAARTEQAEAVRDAIERATGHHKNDERGLHWLFAQVQSDPRPLRHDDNCWLRHLECFAKRVLRDGGPFAVAQELQWARERATAADAEPVADEDREPDPEEPEDADEAQAVGEDRRIAEAEWERDHAGNDDAPLGWEP